LSAGSVDLDGVDESRFELFDKPVPRVDSFLFADAGAGASVDDFVLVNSLERFGTEKHQMGISILSLAVGVGR
jgi:hypothetical protein